MHMASIKCSFGSQVLLKVTESNHECPSQGTSCQAVTQSTPPSVSHPLSAFLCRPETLMGSHSKDWKTNQGYNSNKHKFLKKKKSNAAENKMTIQQIAKRHPSKKMCRSVLLPELCRKVIHTVPASWPEVPCVLDLRRLAGLALQPCL